MCAAVAHGRLARTSAFLLPARGAGGSAGMLQSARAAAGAAAAARGPASTAQLPDLYFGTMTFAWSQASSPVDGQAAAAMLGEFVSAGGVQVDTARIYSAGESEVMLGKVMAEQEHYRGRPRVLGTKVHPSQEGGLSKAGIRGQLAASLRALQVDKVDVLYLHQPDPENDLTESLECMQELLAEGMIAAYGMSNYSAVEVERACSACKERGWKGPSFFQGLFNPLNRWTEDELLPVLRKHGVAFVAYNPLAAGLLTGKHAAGAAPPAGRFKDNPNYLPRFYTDDNFSALAPIQQACEEHGLGMVEATYSWLLRHSALDAQRGDGVLLGASSAAQFQQNLKACVNSQVLPAPVAEAFGRAWEVSRAGAFPYWRSYSRDHPGREALHPGASYDAGKK